MTLHRIGPWRLPVIALASLVIALLVVGVILLLGRMMSPDPTTSPSPSVSASATAAAHDTPEDAVHAFYEAFADARQAGDPSLLEPFVSGVDSSAYQTAAGFILGQAEVDRASVVTVNELSNFDVQTDEESATVTFDHRLGGYDIDLESGEPLESPTILETRRKRAEVILGDGVWLVDSFENVP